jgi:hypothetical protein
MNLRGSRDYDYDYEKNLNRLPLRRLRGAMPSNIVNATGSVRSPRVDGDTSIQ